MVHVEAVGMLMRMAAICRLQSILGILRQAGWSEQEISGCGVVRCGGVLPTECSMAGDMGYRVGLHSGYGDRAEISLCWTVS